MRRFLATFAATIALLATGIVTSATASATTTATFPTVVGSFGTTPTITFPTTAAPTSLESKVLVNGTGTTVKKGDLLVANYVGQIWNGKVFDSSFSRSETAAFPIGVGAVIKGWDDTLVGKKIGSRMLLVVPPSLGYGTSGNSEAGIKGTDILVFVVDLVATYSNSVGSKEKASTVTTTTHGITVKNLQTTAPKISIAKGTTKPTSAHAYLLARGSGNKVKAGMLILQFDAISWAGKAITSTWTTKTPDGEYVGVSADDNPFSALVGDRIGGYALLELPANSNGGPYVLAIHIAAEVPSGAAK